MRATFFLPALLGAALICGTARAEGPEEREARALFAQGNQHARDGDYAGALSLFQSAYAKYPNVKILLNIGTMMQQLGRDVEAVEAYDAYVRDPSADPRRKQEIMKLLAALDARVARLVVTVDDPEASVIVDDSPVAQQDGTVTMRLMPGRHTIKASRKGGKATVNEIVAKAGVEARVSMHVEPPPPSGALSPSSEASDSAGSGRRMAGFVVGGVGVAGLAAGSITGIMALGDHGTVQEGCPSRRGCSQDIVDTADRGKTMSLVSTVGLAVGAVGVGTGLYLILSGKKAEAAPAVEVTPTPDGAQIRLHGRF